MSFYDILKSAKVGCNLPSYYETLFARKLPCSKYAWQETTLSGVPPITFTAKGTALSAYSVTGNMTQTGTPTPSQPIVPEECGDLVTTGEHAGEFAIPLSVSGTDYPLYLSEPLRKIGDYADTVASDGVVTRRIKRLVLDGTENWSSSRNAFGYRFSLGVPDAVQSDLTVGAKSVCTHVSLVATGGTYNTKNSYTITGSHELIIALDETHDLISFKAFLAAQYAANTPVCVWYVLASPVTETTTAPTITPSAGANTLSAGTTLAPSEVSITGKIKEV